MTWQSRVPAVLDALVALWDADPTLSGRVLDGPLPLDSAALEVLAVGDDGSDEGGSAESLLSTESYAVEPDREQFTINCVIEVIDGASDGPAARTRAYELLSAASAALKADHTLGGLVMRANVESVLLSQLQTTLGAKSLLRFTVMCDAYTRR